jgi:hypothetical protein
MMAHTSNSRFFCVVGQLCVNKYLNFVYRLVLIVAVMLRPEPGTLPDDFNGTSLALPAFKRHLMTHH